MKELTVFTHEQFGAIRAVKVDNEIYFVGKDLVERLGYNLTGKHVASEYIKHHCDEEDYILVDKNSPLKYGSVINYKELGQRGGWLVNESGMYSLVLGSELPEAKKFKRWVTSEVLPQIRQTGGYIPVKEEDNEMEILSKAFLIAQKTIETQKARLEQETHKRLLAEQKIEEDKPMVEFANTISASSGSIDIGTFAKLVKDEDIPLGRNKLFDWLRTNKYLMKNNVPYQTYIDNGYFEVVEYTYSTLFGDKLGIKTLVTGKGQIKLVEKLKKEFSK